MIRLKPHEQTVKIETDRMTLKKPWGFENLVHQRLPSPSKRDIIVIRVLVLATFAIFIGFLFWFLDPIHRGHRILFWILAFSFGYKMLHLLYQWFYITSMKPPRWKTPEREWAVDMLTTYVPGEPYDMLVRTLQAMVAVKYPHTTYLCDEGNDPYLKKICEELGVVHVYRGADKTDAKAGNINYTLQHVAKGEICIILDPDHIPVPEFIDRVIPYFEDPAVGYVQSIQGYYNYDKSFVARGAAEQTFLFYGPLMMGMHQHNTVQAIGANCAFRRAALDSIGGHAAGLCEDMHTSMLLHAKKWKGVYAPELLTRGQVPATLSSYYKQQLKWSRGSFNLLFHVYPKLFFKWSWPQRLHYLLTPLYFLYGVIGLIDIGIPIFSLLWLQVPLYINFEDFILRIIPLIFGITIIQHFAQNYVLDDYEKGSHFRGGALRTGTWWVYLLGFIYALIGVKVPYLPTPKETRGRANDWKNSIPNLVVIALSLFAIVYGLNRDFTPFSLIMACFAAANAVILSLVVWGGQQKLRDKAARALDTKASALITHSAFAFRHYFVYRLIRNHYIALLFVVGSLALIYTDIFFEGWSPFHAAALAAPGQKSTGPWLHDAKTASLPGFGTLGPNRTAQANIKSFDLSGWDEQTLARFNAILGDAGQLGVLPFVRWNVPSFTSPECVGIHPAGWKEQESVLIRLAGLARAYQQPVIFCLELALPDSANALATIPDNYQYLVAQFKKNGASNLAFAWPYLPESSLDYPGQETVDLVVLNCIDNDMNYHVAHLLKSKIDKPVVLTASSAHPSPSYEETVAYLLAKGTQVLGWVDGQPMQDSTLRLTARQPPGEPSLQPASPEPKSSLPPGITYDEERQAYRWWHQGAPFYIKGVLYNPEQSQPDKGWPPTRRQLRVDFAKIKAMGANTISRYAPTAYDRNILHAAQEADLMVLYQFQFNPEVDYLKDAHRTAALKKQALSHVERYKDNPTILAWVLGNGTWDELARYFHQPYLTEVRLAYVALVEQIAQEVKKVNPGRPVISALGNGLELAGTLDDFRNGAPSVDILAISGYHPQQLAEAAILMEQWFPGRPYLINEFGPKALPGYPYWPGDRVGPENSFEKARLYADLWTEQIEQGQHNNLGGIAYCWRDRMEHTAIFSGITDYKGRLKPAYYALQKAWGTEGGPFPISDACLRVTQQTGHDDAPLFLCKALSPNNDNPGLHYEWSVSRGEYLEQVAAIQISNKRFQSKFVKYIYYWRKYILRRIHPYKHDKGVGFWINDPHAPYRVYLHIDDKKGNVAAFSYPIPLEYH